MSQGSLSTETPVPSRTLGFMLMSAVIVAVALLAQQRKQQDADEQIPALSLPASLPGFQRSTGTCQMTRPWLCPHPGGSLHHGQQSGG